ncbi:MAG: arginine-tRNA-protein transferase, partial [bacterium]
MKLVFSEYKSDYANYIFPYAIWAIPEPHETPAMIFDQGFLPSSLELDHFYMCRHVRVNLKNFSRTSENRRIIRKCEGIQYELVPRS